MILSLLRTDDIAVIRSSRAFKCIKIVIYDKVLKVLLSFQIKIASVEETNVRVVLQYEFRALGLDDCLKRFGNHESDELAVQITVYVDNVVDVQELSQQIAYENRLEELHRELQQQTIVQMKVSFISPHTQIRFATV